MARIYVIDDDEQLLRMVGLMLERGGHTATLVDNPVEGLEQLKADRPDLLVVDVMMPGMSGHDLTRELRSMKETEDLPILVLTARSQEIDKDTALASGADDYLSKPVTSQELIERVDDLLSRRNGQGDEGDSGMILTFFGVRGGTGRTTLAVNLAAALRRQSQREVCLVDFSSSGSQCVMHVRLQARSSWSDLVKAGSFDWDELKSRLLIHQSGLRILAAPSSPKPPDYLLQEMAVSILEMLRAKMTFVIVDLPPVLSPAMLASLKLTDMALHVLSPDVISVQTAVQLNRSLKKAGMSIAQKSHLLNQVTPEAQLSQSTVERGLNARIAFHIGYDPNQARSLAQGVPLSLTKAKSPLPSITKRMAEVIWKRVNQSA